MIGSILVGLGGGGESARYTESAVRTAVDLGKRYGSNLTGATVVNPSHLVSVGPTPIGAGSFAADMRAHRLAETQEHVATAIVDFEDACSAAGLSHQVLREERDKPLDYVTSQARYHDLTVIGLRGLFEYGVCGEATYDPADTLVKLIHGGVRPIIATGPEHREIGRVLIAYSGSAQSAKTMRRFVQMNLWPDADVRIAAFGTDQTRRERHLRHAVDYCRSHGFEAEPVYRPGDPKTGVLDLAHEWGADLIVLGNSERTLLLRKVLGDTVLHTIRHSDLPLFLCE